MSTSRKPFRSRWAGRPNTFAVINHHGTKLTGEEVASIIEPVRECFAQIRAGTATEVHATVCLLYTSPSPRDLSTSRMPSSA